MIVITSSSWSFTWAENNGKWKVENGKWKIEKNVEKSVKRLARIMGVWYTIVKWETEKKG